jgi:molecular chaperone GrpE (heat shock protein)
MKTKKTKKENQTKEILAGFDRIEAMLSELKKTKTPKQMEKIYKSLNKILGG